MKDQVSVGIDESGQHHAPAAVEGPGLQSARFGVELARRPDADNFFSRREHRTVADDAELFKLSTAARRPRAGKRQELRGVAKEESARGGLGHLTKSRNLLELHHTLAGGWPLCLTTNLCAKTARRLFPGS